jgi:hypothetical protein
VFILKISCDFWKLVVFLGYFEPVFAGKKLRPLRTAHPVWGFENVCCIGEVP